MHELGLARNIISIVSEHARQRPVSRVRLVLGPGACVEPQSLAFCFKVIGEGTVVDGAALDIIPGQGDEFIIKDFDIEEAV